MVFTVEIENSPQDFNLCQFYFVRDYNGVLSKGLLIEFIRAWDANGENIDYIRKGQTVISEIRFNKHPLIKKPVDTG